MRGREPDISHIVAAAAMPALVRVSAAIASLLLAVSSLRIFGGADLTPLSEPLPFHAYPFLAITLVGWAWARVRSRPVKGTPRR